MPGSFVFDMDEILRVRPDEVFSPEDRMRRRPATTRSGCYSLIPDLHTGDTGVSGFSDQRTAGREKRKSDYNQDSLYNVQISERPPFPSIRFTSSIVVSFTIRPELYPLS